MSATRSLLIGLLAFLVIAGLLIFMGGLFPGQSGQGAVPGIGIGGPYTLVAADDRTVTDQTYRDKWQLIYFGYTMCPDACPTALNDIAGALAALGPLAAQVQPIFITVDPDRDTREVLGKYVTAFDPRIVGLTGTPEQIATVAKAYRVYYAKVPDKDAPDGYLMDHSSVIYVMRPGDGRLVATFTHETSSEQMTERLRKLLAKT